MTRSVPRISTRGYYDLTNGTTLKKNPYHLYPKKDFEKLIGSKELTIMIHGLGNDNAGAVEKVIIARNKLRRLGYHYPVVGFSYDSNTSGGHLMAFAKHALAVGQMIAKKNGRNLAIFIEDFKSISPKTKIRLMGHSLGSQVILSTVQRLSKFQNTGIIESAHFFGASIPNDVPSSKKYGPLLQRVIRGKIVNYYSPNDEVLFWGDHANFVAGPLGLNGATGKTISKYHQKLVTPQNHRFASYAAVLKSFP
jgi:pimeloyl-ACP methyl ester carboxylesterase